MIDRRRLLVLLAIAAVSPALRARAAETLRMRDLYEKDLSFSALARELEGARVEVSGFMAPPLKAQSRFFVLTKRPMAVCPFCESEAEWPDDILAVFASRVVDAIPFNVPILSGGVLRLGAHTDAETGFVSRVRLERATVARA
ncbi:hypothetical protein SAMN05444336_101679 [Albimonas donghaensis]|uniref:DUF3299 domain-containing protein n=1 Tax=Albimonas donghaensis TaxID=356660 RepID=A0A1H2SIW6_9RHOB|nr:hypothetical protein [Albimonas donghaensis]SDW31643.1 hypothetical protein SAMN05444336_101679 [Albimonas donghaensis]